MVEAQTWTRRMSNPRLDSTVAVAAADQVLDIPATPTAELKNSTYAVGSHVSPNLLTAVIIASWFMSNIGVLLLNKYLLSFYGYRYPIFLTMLHMLSCASYSYVAINLLGIVPRQHILSRKQLLKILALCVIFCFSVVCGNTSLRYIPVSFNQAIGATTPFFTAIFAFLITCKKELAEVYFALLPVVFGIVLATNSEPLFNLFGFLVCIGSTSGRALKSVVQGILLTNESEKLHSMNLLLYMAPMAAMILLPFSLYIEGNVAGLTLEKARIDSFIIFLLIGNATVAYLVNLTNFLVTKHTSALTLQVLGNAKAALAAFVSVMVFRNPVTVMGISGFAVTIMGVVLYSEAKKRSKCAPSFRPLLARLEERLKRELDEVLTQEEKLWHQRSQATWIAEGDRTTAYYHMSTRIRHEHNKVCRLRVGFDAWCADPAILQRHAHAFFRSLFTSEGFQPDHDYSETTFRHFTGEDLRPLVALITIEEVRRHSAEVDLCDICMHGREDIDHVLRMCIVAEGTWSRLIPPELTFVPSDDDWFVRFTILCWLLWKRRCSLVLVPVMGAMEDFISKGNRLVIECKQSFHEQVISHRAFHSIVLWKWPPEWVD
ncbi:hypothetical protein V6N13_142023 [Hibiscus sabdariffa]